MDRKPLRPDGAGFVAAARTIAQSPLTDAPDVPAGRRGHIEDEVDGYVFVDFGGPYGTICCDEDDLQ